MQTVVYNKKGHPRSNPLNHKPTYSKKNIEQK